MIPVIPDALLSASLMVNSVSSRATSQAAQDVAEECDKNRARLKESIYLGHVFDELSGTYEQCREQNWDGYGATAVEERTFRNTRRLLESLWLRTPTPSVGAEADGHLTLEWYQSPRCTLSISVSPEGDLHYAALLGDSKAYGSEPFFGNVPTPILNLIQQVHAA